MIVSVTEWPPGCTQLVCRLGLQQTTLHTGDCQNSLSARRIRQKFRWLRSRLVGQSTSQRTRTPRTPVMFRLLQ
ncbi:hypothetical protein T11_9187 [Trichinella zimbabwensis]|uniref:Uncharacterized protein n=1 Tax=Trichinella zimbabwensis TaxID=268475 RepID=A0A0V1GPS5_9BILA|nr:hypothetical protein T11_930 [Trichinella zimbabwensis]KRZ00344.1 hypothetical protein T11_9187 [Trichinella zimbabwensis]